MGYESRASWQIAYMVAALAIEEQHMNQPTEDRIKRLEERQKQLEEEICKLKEQRTDEMKAINVNVTSQDVTNRLKTLEEDTAVLKIEMQGARADISNIKATQSDHSEYLKEDRQTQSHHSEKLDQHTEVLGQLVSFAESHNALLKATATKEDLAALRDEQGQKLDQILKLLQTRGE